MTDPACIVNWYTIQKYTVHQCTSTPAHSTQIKLKVDNQNHRIKIKVDGEDKKKRFTAILLDVKVF